MHASTRQGKAIVKMPPPCNKKEVQSFIGMINYLTKFSPHLTEFIWANQRADKRKSTFSNWGPEHQESFNLLKKELVRTPVLAYYNPRKETVLQTDASTKGLGACLLQDNKPIYFASKALTEMQRRYIAIEVESLAVAWAVEKFYHFLYGCHFILETDQKPLEAIFFRSLNQLTPRLQHILIRTLPYTFTIRYIPGTRNLLTDCLSRLGNQEDAIKLPKLHVYQISHQLLARSDSLQEIRQATQTDDELALLKHTIMTSWPANIREIPQVLHPYWTLREELTIEDGLILIGTRSIIPTKKHKVILRQIHDSHLGFMKCKLHAQASSILARAKWSARATYTKLPVMPEILKIQKKARWKFYIRPRNSNYTPGKASNWFIPLWRTVIPPHCRLHKLIPNCQKAYIYDCSAYSRSL